MKMGIDAGNHEVKVVTPNGAFKFSSTIGEWREINLDNKHGDSDMLWHYEGDRGFAGTLADAESYMPSKSKGTTKAHREAMLRVLFAIHRYSDENVVDIIVGQPIIGHNKTEKDKLKKMLKKEHTMKINGKSKTFEIRNVEVVAEGAGVYWSQPREGLVRVIDVGSGTVNYVTVKDKRYIDKESGTIAQGMNTIRNRDLNALANYIYSEVSSLWDKNDFIYLAGGAANEMFEPLMQHFPNLEVVRPGVKKGNGMEVVHPVLANAVGFYNIARTAYDE